MKPQLKKSADLVETKKGFFIRYSSEGITRTFASKSEALDFAKKNNMKNV